MPKGKNRSTAGGSVNYLYLTQDDLHWTKIESVAQKSFDAVERREIFRCVSIYSEELSWLRAAASDQDVRALQEALVKHAAALCELAERFRPLKDKRAKDEDAKALDTLCAQSRSGDFFLRDEFHRTAIAAQRLVAGLRRSEPRKVSPISSETDEVLALATLITAILEFAEQKEARSFVPGGWNAPAYQYLRWGVPIGPKNQVFAAFLRALLPTCPPRDALIRAAFARAERPRLG